MEIGRARECAPVLFWQVLYTGPVNVLTFDIETIPDIEAGRRLYDLGDLSDEDVIQAMRHLRSQETGGSDFQRHFLHRIVAISLALATPRDFRLWTLGEPEDSEPEAIKRFFDGIDRFTPVLVSWNGGGFDLPVLHYRALLHGVAAPRYWETGGEDREFKWNNYLNRFHERHLDLMDVLSGYQQRAAAPLDRIATLLGLPGKMGMDGSKVWDAYRDGDLDGIRNYCETDVLNTHLVYLRFELIRGRLTPGAYGEECKRIRDALLAMEKPHLNEFVERWRAEPA